MFKVGLVGNGSIANCHLSAYERLFKEGKVEVVAFCDINPDQLKMMAEKYGVPAERTFTDKDEMLRALPEIDAVSVCTWNSAHAECTIAALNAGKHVICEKPMAMNAAEAYKRLYETHSKQAKDAATALDKSLGTVSALICFTLDYILNPETQEFKHFRTSFAVGATATVVSTKYSLLGSVPTFLNITVTIQVNLTNSWTKDGMLSSTDFESYSGNIKSIIDDAA